VRAPFIFHPKKNMCFSVVLVILFLISFCVGYAFFLAWRSHLASVLYRGFFSSIVCILIRGDKDESID